MPCPPRVLFSASMLLPKTLSKTFACLATLDGCFKCLLFFSAMAASCPLNIFFCRTFFWILHLERLVRQQCWAPNLGSKALFDRKRPEAGGEFHFMHFEPASAMLSLAWREVSCRSLAWSLTTRRAYTQRQRNDRHYFEREACTALWSLSC